MLSQQEILDGLSKNLIENYYNILKYQKRDRPLGIPFFASLSPLEEEWKLLYVAATCAK